MIATTPGPQLQDVEVSWGGSGPLITYSNGATAFYATFATRTGWETQPVEGIHYAGGLYVRPLRSDAAPSLIGTNALGVGDFGLLLIDWTTAGWTVYQLLTRPVGPEPVTYLAARDASGGLHVARSSEEAGAPLLYHHWDGDKGSIRFVEEQVHPAPARISSILTDFQGRPSMFLTREAGPAYAHRRDGVWQVQDVPAASLGSSAMTARGEPVNCYTTTGSTMNVWRIECVRHDDGAWRVSRVADDLRVEGSGWFQVLQTAVDSQDRIHLTYYVLRNPGGNTTTELNYTHETESGWQTQTVDTRSGFTSGGGLLIGPDDRPLVIYGKGLHLVAARPLGTCGPPPEGTLCSAVRCDACPLFEGSCLVCSGHSWQTSYTSCADANDGGSCDAADSGSDAGALEADAGTDDAGKPDAGVDDAGHADAG